MYYITRTLLLGIFVLLVTLWATFSPDTALADSLPTGWLDVATGNRLAGWARDPDYSGSIDVHVYIQYNGQGNLQFLMSARANIYRSDLPGYYGFEFNPSTSPAYHSPLGSNHKIYIYAINVNSSGTPIGSGNTQLNGTPKTVSYKPIASTTGIYVRDINIEPYCPSKSVKIDVWQAVNGSWKFHNRCYTNNTSADNDYPFETYCPFKYTIPAGTSASNILVRAWKMNSSCTQYMDEIDPGPSSYRDHSPVSNVVSDSAFRGLGRSVKLERSTYSILVDRNGGAVYEFYNKRGTDPNLPSGKYENAVHAHFGAALQIAIHKGSLGSLTPNACAGQGYWNPTQAGASCGYNSSHPLSPVPGSNLTVKCDGVANNNCTTATNIVEHTLHRMMNWDYGPNYQGPYNAGDTSQLGQKVTAFDNYVQFDVTLKNTGGLKDDAALEIPTFYFTNRYRKMYYPSSSGSITSLTIPLNVTGNDNNNYLKIINSHDLQWVTVENTSLGVTNNHITIAWFYQQPFINDLEYPYTQIEEGDLYDNIKFTNAPRFDYKTNVVYTFRFVIFPYKYNETITTQYGTMTVQQTINAMDANFGPASNPNSFSNRIYLPILLHP